MTAKPFGIVGRAGVLLPIIVLLLLGPLVSHKFFTAENLLSTLQSVALLGIVSVGLSFVTYAGQFVDMSIPTIMALSGILTVSTLPFGFVPALIVGLASGCLVGLINGWTVGYWRANPILWTLVTAAVGEGLIRWLYSGKQAYPAASAAGQAFLGLYDLRVFGLQFPLITLAVLLVLGQLILAETTVGFRLKLTGSSFEAARLGGIDTRRQCMFAFVASAFGASVGGILLTSLNRVGAAYIGKGYEFMAATAVVLGGVSLAGGKGSVLGVLGGALVIGLLNNLMTLMGLDSPVQLVVQGAVFIVAVGAGAFIARRAGEAA